MESCSLSPYLKFILDIHSYEKLVRESKSKTNDQQMAALSLFQRYLSVDAKYLVPIDDETRQLTLCKIIKVLQLFD